MFQGFRFSATSTFTMFTMGDYLRRVRLIFCQNEPLIGGHRLPSYLSISVLQEAH